MTDTNDKVPVTVLTGFLGAGKTTLLNRILTENHGQRIAVIENEFGEIGVDQELVINAEEEIFEMNNGCICCTVRGDLIRILGSLMKRRDRFDRIVVETTGMANPGPVAQTFFVDDDMRERFALDGIVTLVDARHFGQQVDANEEAREQVAFADVIVLNKTDLVTATELEAVERRVRAMNALARIVRSDPAARAAVPVDSVLGIGGFDLSRALEYKPTFLEPEYPFEWAGRFDLAAGRHELVLGEGPDPDMGLALFPAPPVEAEDPARVAAERAFKWFAEDVEANAPGTLLRPAESLAILDLQGTGSKRFPVQVDAPGRYWLVTQHLPEEFALALHDPQGRPVRPGLERAFAAGHTHDDEVGSISLETEEPLDPRRFSDWLSRELQAQGASIYRMKGFLNFKGVDQRVVIQGVHMLTDNTTLGPWGEKPRRTQLVFIGRNLDTQALIDGFDACLAD
ncbi:MAG: GTP-binding protein [Steroidobacteraceae bacterium]|jgi:G3E family GTPase|nr:GTP-binding protein [Steroidobacteraceae bacterium]